MREIIVEPLKKVGDIYFGMSRSQVREIMGEYKEFKKSRFSKNTADDFNECHIYYDSNNLCQAIELYGEYTIKIKEDLIIPNNFTDICRVLKTLDKNVEIENDTCTSIKYSIGIYAPDGKVESILFGIDGYYN